MGGVVGLGFALMLSAHHGQLIGGAERSGGSDTPKMLQMPLVQSKIQRWELKEQIGRGTKACSRRWLGAGELCNPLCKMLLCPSPLTWGEFASLPAQLQMQPL